MQLPDPLSDDEIAKWFGAPPAPPAHTYELALVLGGTVSAGAYTAGALDFLFEALDQWTELRNAGDPSAPTHRVQIRVIAGTSGGGVNAAIAARALAWRYPAVSQAVLPQDGPTLAPPYGKMTGNPFYDVWCNMLRLGGFLDTADLQKGVAGSILSGKPIDDAAEYIAGFSADVAARRSYLGEPLLAQPMRVILTLTNLNGIPYRTTFDGPAGEVVQGEMYVDHADYMRFGVDYGGFQFAPRPDETVLTAADQPAWDNFSLFARATAAFPLGFPARGLSRATLDYRYRVTVFPPERDADPWVRPLTPAWEQLQVNGDLPGSYAFTSVDGGATDNEPIELARTALCGVAGRNPRSKTTANRGVLLIDPFAGEADLGKAPVGLLQLAGATLTSLLQQTRYDSDDIMMAGDPDIYSRFMVSAYRDGISGSRALASGGVGAFVGFACPDFMRYDYLLGRANCQAILRHSFVVDPANPVVAGQWTPGQIAANGYTDNTGSYVQLIPLLGTAAQTQATDPWPFQRLDPDAFRTLIQARWKALLDAEISGTWWKAIIDWLGDIVTRDAIANYVRDTIKTDLQTWQLLPAPPPSTSSPPAASAPSA